MGQQGFTLVEQIVTVAIMAAVLTAGIAALSTGALGLAVTASGNQAMNLAQEQLECIKGATFSASYSGSCTTNSSGYTVTTTLFEAQYVNVPGQRGLIRGLLPCTPTTCPNVQWVQVSIYRSGGNAVLVIEDLKVDRP